MISYSDIFKSSYLAKVTSISLFDMVLSLSMAFCLGMFIYLIYRKTYQGVMYSSSFGVTLVAVTMISTFVILAVTSNVVLSLGMVGALSIVRFRTAIKEPLDIAFLFWAVGVGIVLAAGLIPLAVFGSVVIGVVLLVFAGRRESDTPFIVVLTAENEEAERKALDLLDQNSKKMVIKSKSARKGQIEDNLEVRLTGGDTSFINAISDLDGVVSAVLVSYSGDYMG